MHIHMRSSCYKTSELRASMNHVTTGELETVFKQYGQNHMLEKYIHISFLYGRFQ